VVDCAATLCDRPVITVASLLGGQPGQPGQGRHRAVSHELEGLAHLQLFDVLGQVATRHALVDVLVPGQRRELLDARLHVVARHQLAGSDGVEIDPVDHLLVGLDDPVGYVDPHVTLGPQHGDPEPALEHDLVLGRPDRGEVGRGVPHGEDVGDAHASSPRPVGGRAGSRPLAMSRRHCAPGKLIMETPS